MSYVEFERHSSAVRSGRMRRGPAYTRVVRSTHLEYSLPTVAWHHDGDAYWISNTLTEDLTNNQMVSIAASLMQ
jgi:hypothetical protein